MTYKNVKGFNLLHNLADGIGKRISGVRWNIGALKKSGVLVVFAIAMAGVIGATAVLTTQTTFTNTGSMKAVNVEVYWDSACTDPVSEVDWGVLEPGDTVVKTIYVKNGGNTDLTLSMTTGGWSVGAGEFIDMTWNQEGNSLIAGDSVAADLTLSVDASITGVDSFSFDITIQGTG